MLHPWLFVGFTGHRKISHPEAAGGAIREVLGKLRGRTGWPLAAVSSAASGGDTLFSEAVLEQKIPWVALLPFPVEEFRKDFDSESWARTERALAQAAQTQIEPPTTDRKEAFLACGVRTVENCDVLVALWDGAEAAGRGGTAEIVAYARSQEKPLVWIHAITGALVEEHLGKLPQDESVAPAANPPPASAEGGRSELAATLEHFDREAVVHGPMARSLTTQAIFFQLVATAVGLSAPILGFWAWLAFLLVLCKVGTLGYAGLAHHRRHHTHQRWTRARVIAELCRSSLATWFLPYSERVQLPLPVPGFRAWQHSLRLCRILAPPEHRSLDDQKSGYLRERVQDQLGYFEKQVGRTLEKLATGRRWARICTYLAMALGVIAIVMLVARGISDSQNWWETPTTPEAVSATGSVLPKVYHHAENVLKFLTLLLPLASAAILHWMVAQDYGRRVSRYRQMTAYLRWAQRRVNISGTANGFAEIVSEIETMLLLEVLEWHSVAHVSKEIHA